MSARRSLPAVYLMALVVACDQVTKMWVYETLTRTLHTIKVNSFFSIVLTWNKGVTFGLLNQFAPSVMPMVLTVAGFLILIFLGRWLWRTSSSLVALSLGLIMGGAIGNIIDRLRFGAVIDFLDFYYRDYHWYAFNIADAAIVTGVSLLVLDSLVRGR